MKLIETTPPPAVDNWKEVSVALLTQIGCEAEELRILLLEAVGMDPDDTAHMANVGARLAAQIGLIADMGLAKAGVGQVRGDASDWLVAPSVALAESRGQGGEA